jgi:hypothetical protein
MSPMCIAKVIVIFHIMCLEPLLKELIRMRALGIWIKIHLNPKSKLFFDFGLLPNNSESQGIHPARTSRRVSGRIIRGAMNLLNRMLLTIFS